MRFALEGEHIVMREAMIDGPLLPEINTEFEQMRAEFLAEAYPHVPHNYQSVVAAEWHRLLNAKADRIYFWFDADAFCQVNFLFWLEWLYQHPDFYIGRSVFYIRPQPEDFTEMSPADYFGCFNDAAPLGPALLGPAHGCWQALAMGDFEGLEIALKAVPRNHHALRNALSWYLKNYRPDPKTGHPTLAVELAKYFERNPQIAAFSKEEKFRVFSQQHKRAGLGDLQFWRLIGEVFK